MDYIQDYQLLNSDKNEIFIINNYQKKCSTHNQRLDILKVDDITDKQKLKCTYCLSQSRFRSIPIKQLLECNSSTIIQGWPILDNSQIDNYLRQIPNKDDFIKQKVEEVQVYYKCLRSKINLLIEKKEKDSILNIERIMNNFEYPIDLYNRISQKEALKDIIKNQHQDFQKQNESFSKIVRENLENQEFYQQQLQNSFNILNNIQMDLKSHKRIQEQLIQLIEQLNDFSSLKDNRNIQMISQNLQLQQYQNKPSFQDRMQQIQMDIQNPQDDSVQNIQQIEMIEINTLSDLERISNFKCIKINFQNQILQDQGIKLLTQTLENCKNMNQLQLLLDKSNVKTDFIKQIAQSLQKCQKITNLKLSLYKNDIQKEGAEQLALFLRNSQNISHLNLDLQKNNILDEGLKGIMLSLEQCQNIRSLELYIAGNNIEIEGAKQIALSLEKMRNITDLCLSISKNKLKLDGVMLIVQALQNCQKITNLFIFLKGYKIRLEEAIKIAQTLEKCQNITELTLNLKNNKITEEEKNYIEIELKNVLKKLNKLYVEV